jgi:hypothetical protein
LETEGAAAHEEAVVAEVVGGSCNFVVQLKWAEWEHTQQTSEIAATVVPMSGAVEVASWVEADATWMDGKGDEKKVVAVLAAVQEWESKV